MLAESRELAESGELAELAVLAESGELAELAELAQSGEAAKRTGSARIENRDSLGGWSVLSSPVVPVVCSQSRSRARAQLLLSAPHKSAIMRCLMCMCCVVLAVCVVVLLLGVCLLLCCLLCDDVLLLGMCLLVYCSKCIY